MSDNHCSRCGAVLPEVDEGLCPVCQTPFGNKTMAIEVTSDDLAKFAAARQAGRDASMPGLPSRAPAPTAPITLNTRATPGGIPKSLVVGIALVVAALIAVLAMLLLR